MVQPVEFIEKKGIKTKQLVIFLMTYLINSLQLFAQNCIDTIHIKGYYVVKRIESELTSEIKRNGNVATVEQRIDTHCDPSFVPCDSISKGHPLSYWLNHFFDDAKQVFISCEKFSAKDFVEKRCLQDLKNNKDTCRLPLLKSNMLYKTTNVNSGDVFEIYYIDAYWAKVKVEKGSLEADLVPSKIAQRWIGPSVSKFDLYCFVNYDSVELNPKINDPHIKVWKK